MENFRPTRATSGQWGYQCQPPQSRTKYTPPNCYLTPQRRSAALLRRPPLIGHRNTVINSGAQSLTGRVRIGISCSWRSRRQTKTTAMNTVDGRRMYAGIVTLMTASTHALFCPGPSAPPPTRGTHSSFVSRCSVNRRPADEKLQQSTAAAAR